MSTVTVNDSTFVATVLIVGIALLAFFMDCLR